MNEFKYHIVNILLLGLLGFGIYWAFSTIDNGIIYDKDLVEDSINNENENIEIQDPVIFDNTKPESTETVNTSDQVEEIEQNQEQNQITLSDNEKFLLKKLQGLIDDQIQMKNGSHGTRVGTVQKVLNLYFKEQAGVDNEYGPTTISRVKEFQQLEGLGADGFAGINTYKKMIEVINNQAYRKD